MPRLEGLIPPQTGVAIRARAGETLRLIDPEGSQVCDLFCFTDDPERVPLSAGRSADYNDTILFTRGNRLFSFEGDPLLEITHDTCGRHDFLVTPCSQQMFRMMNGREEHHPSCLENLERAFAPFGVDRYRIGTTFNAFMNVQIAADGRLQVLPPLSKAGDHVDFLLKRDLLIGLTACSDPGSNGGRCKPIRYAVL
jgi:uncharacterized protein YcgI (DUF1989 family)